MTNEIKIKPNTGQERELPKDDGERSSTEQEQRQRAVLENGCDGQKAPGRMVFRRLEQMGDYLHSRKVALLAGVAVYAFNCEKLPAHFHADINTFGISGMTPEQRGTVIAGLEHVLEGLKRQQS